LRDLKGAAQMNDIFNKSERGRFVWEQIGDIKLGRGNLGEEMPVLLYRLMQFTMMDALREKYGTEAADDIIRTAGFKAGVEFTNNCMNLELDFDSFISSLQETLKNLKVGILRVEYADVDKGKFIFTVSEDLDCSGLPIIGETVCMYDEGFIAGILETYTKNEFDVKEVDCWATGDRTCRFEADLTVTA